jgi:hypothetical protein
VNTLKRHLSVANVLSCVAIFLALGGAAVAAGKVKLGPSQVKAVNIANQAVTNAKIKTQAVTSGKIKNNGVVTADLANGAVNAAKLANGAVNSAKLGKEAVQAKALAKNAVTNGKIGAEAVTTGKIGNEAISAAKISSALYLQLLKNVRYETATSVNDSATSKSVVASCPAGREVIGGGVKINGASTDPKNGVVVSTSAPVTSATNARVGWEAAAREVGEEPASWQVVAYAVCAEL